MSELYSFLFCLGLGVGARVLYMLTTVLAKRTNILPVTIVLDFLCVAIVGCALTAYIIVTGAVMAPYMFAALGAAYYFSYLATKKFKRKRADTERDPEPEA